MALFISLALLFSFTLLYGLFTQTITIAMLLGKRQRPSFHRTTSLSEIKFDMNLPSEQELVTVDEHRQVHHSLLDQRLLTMRRHSADNSGDFLRSCSLCKRHLLPSRDIYMYRGDMAFCSLECRQQKMTVDEREDKCSITGGSAQGERVSTAV